MIHYNSFRPRRDSQGFSLLEILVAMVVISIGILGIAGLQASALKFSKNSESRALAVQYSMDMLERLRANDAGFQGGEYGSLANMTSATCQSSLPPISITANAAADIAQWTNALACSLPSGSGRIVVTPGASATGLRLVEVTVQWDESRLKGGSSTQSITTRTFL